MAIEPYFWPRYCWFHVWPSKFKVKVMPTVKLDDYIWRPKFNQYACFTFRGNRTIFGWDIANSIFDLENWRSRSRRKSNQVIYWSGPTIVPKMKEIQKVVQSLRPAAAAAGYKNIKSSPVYRGDLISKINRLWPKSNQFWRRSRYISMPNSRPFLPHVENAHKPQIWRFTKSKCCQNEENH